MVSFSFHEKIDPYTNVESGILLPYDLRRNKALYFELQVCFNEFNQKSPRMFIRPVITK